MKKVRFESPNKDIFKGMGESECHSPRPFIEQQRPPQAPEYCTVTYSSDPMHRFEYSDSSPYPVAKKTVEPTLPTLCAVRPNVLPSNDLNLSMLDIHEPRTPCITSYRPLDKNMETKERVSFHPNVLSAIDNIVTPPNVLQKDNSFFIRRDNLNKYNFHMNPLQHDFNRLSLDKENDPLAKNAEMTTQNKVLSEKRYTLCSNRPIDNDCNCHHCIKPNHDPQFMVQTQNPLFENMVHAKPALKNTMTPHRCQQQIMNCFYCEQNIEHVHKICHCAQNAPAAPENAVDKKTWAIERYEQSKKADCMEIEKQTNVIKEKREPTISDLLKIIKLQNEQLQLLQEKVDKFISTSNSQQQAPIQNYMTEHVALQTIDSEHKISIGVMTSFEMVRTSTVINKEILKQNDTAQIHCNRSQISVKEVVSKRPVNTNFLDGIAPVGNLQPDLEPTQTMQGNDMLSRNINEEKTLNELSLYNVQVDNATTPLMSPDQSLYLDVRDYSDSDSVSSDDQSNVGWTYYNKVMTHVNGMLQDSDMPSSASALFRNARRQCVQMQVDKTNVSVTKRVKFGDDPMGIHQPHIYAAATDTSLKMNQLAAKYLKPAGFPHRLQRPTTNPADISFATRNYMERHKLLQGLPATSRSPPPGEMPRFLDITALKQQPKFL